MSSLALLTPAETYAWLLHLSRPGADIASADLRLGAGDGTEFPLWLLQGGDVLTNVLRLAKAGDDPAVKSTRLIAEPTGLRNLTLPDVTGTIPTREQLAAVQTFANEDAAIAAASRRVWQTGTMSASRTLTLPAAAAVPAGEEIIVGDASGSVTATNTIVIARAGSDTINGATSATIAHANGTLRLISNGTDAWVATVPDSHAVLSGLQGGAAGERYHLTSAQHTAATAAQAAGTASIRALGTGSSNAAAGDDARFDYHRFAILNAAENGAVNSANYNTSATAAFILPVGTWRVEAMAFVDGNASYAASGTKAKLNFSGAATNTGILFYTTTTGATSTAVPNVRLPNYGLLDAYQHSSRSVAVLWRGTLGVTESGTLAIQFSATTATEGAYPSLAQGSFVMASNTSA
jgi:hypothetical protein